MSSTHVDSLRQKHSDLDRMVAEALRSPSANDNEIMDLKRRKLALKDEIARFEAANVRH
jgi:hypothetical protein